MNVRDIVEPISHEYALRSGCCAYHQAVVVSMKPFVLVSLFSDMKWSCTVKPEHFIVVGELKDDAMFERCLMRL